MVKELRKTLLLTSGAIRFFKIDNYQFVNFLLKSENTKTQCKHFITLTADNDQTPDYEESSGCFSYMEIWSVVEAAKEASPMF